MPVWGSPASELHGTFFAFQGCSGHQLSSLERHEGAEPFIFLQLHRIWSSCYIHPRLLVEPRVLMVCTLVSSTRCISFHSETAVWQEFKWHLKVYSCLCEPVLSSPLGFVDRCHENVKGPDLSVCRAVWNLSATVLRLRVCDSDYARWPLQYQSAVAVSDRLDRHSSWTAHSEGQDGDFITFSAFDQWDWAALWEERSSQH